MLEVALPPVTIATLPELAVVAPIEDPIEPLGVLIPIEVVDVPVEPVVVAVPVEPDGIPLIELDADAAGLGVACVTLMSTTSPTTAAAARPSSTPALR